MRAAWELLRPSILLSFAAVAAREAMVTAEPAGPRNISSKGTIISAPRSAVPRATSAVEPGFTPRSRPSSFRPQFWYWGSCMSANTRSMYRDSPMSRRRSEEVLP